MTLRQGTLLLAALATGTAICMSVLAGWQRGGWLTERLVWVATGIVLVVGAHLLPALARDASISIRSIGALIWGACLVTACYGHVTFFLLAQQHAGDRRVAFVTGDLPPAPERGLTVVMMERATVVRELVSVSQRSCLRACTSRNARRMALQARLDALDAEASDVRHIEAQRDRVTGLADSRRADPITSRLAASIGTTVERVDLLSGVLFAGVLEGAACLLWTIALRPSPIKLCVPSATPPDSAVVAHSHVPATTGDDPVIHGDRTAEAVQLVPSLVTNATDDEITRLARDVAAGHVRPTVGDIRRHLRCSQTRASALRRQLAKVTA
ncbi:hypothetical protein [Burkholderia vietnamiensis]|jgi:hypothetical protein|uniref:hypothetical protein n=1 Tax=Burkholderia vietnamiensis TaxID=60552 RepID=UPI0010417CF9|nr:hypothetical protein [Burkholderia vietnamiensis]